MDKADKDRTVYQEKMEAKLDKVKADMLRLEADLREKKIDTKQGLQEKLDQLHGHSEGVKTKLSELKSASGAAWDEAKEGLSGAWHELESAFEKATAEFKHPKDKS